MCSFDLIAILRGGPYSAVTHLRDIPSFKSSFLEVHLAQGVTFWVSTQAPQPLATRPGSVSTFLLYHAHGSPLGVALSWVVSVPGASQRWRGYFTSQVTPTGTRTMALKPPFSYCSEVLRPLVVSPPPRSFLPVGIGGRHRRRLNLATPHPGDALSWRRLIMATP